MADQSTPAYLTATFVAAVWGIVGVWLPSVRKLPVGYVDGQPYYTMEYVWGMNTGLAGHDRYVILLAVTVVALVVLGQYRGWRPNLSLIGAGTLLGLFYGIKFNTYWAIDRYAIDLGLYLLLASGVLFALVGAGSIVERRLVGRSG